MPLHNNLILNEGKLLSTREVNMPKLLSLEKAVRDKSQPTFKRHYFDDNICKYSFELVKNDNPKPFPPMISYIINELDCGFFKDKSIKIKNRFWLEQQKLHKDIIYDYLDILPFYPCIMINISPDWKGKECDKFARVKTIPLFTQVIDNYLQTCARYSKWQYVIESGSDDDFIHAHIVAEFNKDCIKSVETHIRKGNHQQELRKIWNKLMPKGKQGKLKGKFAIQSTILRNEQLRDDKYQYLIESNKPVGHKNKVNLDLLFSGSLITSKDNETPSTIIVPNNNSN